MYPEIQAKIRKGAASQNPVAPGARNPEPGNRNPEAGTLEVLPVRGSIYMLAGAGDKVLAAIQQLQRELVLREPPVDPRWGAETRGALQSSLNPIAPPKPIRYIINT